MYRHSRISNNPNEYHEEMKPESISEDGNIVVKEDKNDKKNIKNKNNWDISTNTEKDENNIDNDVYNISNIKKDDDNEEKIDDEIPYQSKISDINKKEKNNINNINNINNENNIDNENNNNNIDNENNEDNEDNDDNDGNEGNEDGKENNLIMEEDENSANINKNDKGMSEKDY